MIHAPNLTALRYEGEEPHRFKHLMGVRVFPLLSKGDIVLVPSITAHQLRKKTEFVVVDLNEIIGVDVVVPVSEADVDKVPEGDVNPECDKAPAEDGTQEGDKAPAEDGTQEGDKAPEGDVNQEGDKVPEADVNPEGDVNQAPKTTTKQNSNKSHGKH